VVLLVDSSKLGKVHAYTFARLEDVDYMVTDGELPAEILTEIKRKGVDVL
jgi:DeoR/GlpR family transcriptional regulator of sugar metabolism